jgi:hypothetical protein
MKRRSFVAGAAALAGAATIPSAVLAAVPPAPSPRDRTLPVRSWETLQPVPALRLTPGDHVTEWVNTHELTRHRGAALSDLPAGSWPGFLAAFAAGAVGVCRFYPEADPADLIAEYGLSRALELAWERHEAHIISSSPSWRTEPW